MVSLIPSQIILILNVTQRQVITVIQLTKQSEQQLRQEGMETLDKCF